MTAWAAAVDEKIAHRIAQREVAMEPAEYSFEVAEAGDRYRLICWSA